MNQFVINDKGELNYKGEIIRILPEYQFLQKEQKLELLIMLVNWANEEIENL